MSGLTELGVVYDYNIQTIYATLYKNKIAILIKYIQV